jgi:hypothetical protein
MGVGVLRNPERSSLAHRIGSRFFRQERLSVADAGADCSNFALLRRPVLERVTIRTIDDTHAKGVASKERKYHCPCVLQRWLSGPSGRSFDGLALEVPTHGSAEQDVKPAPRLERLKELWNELGPALVFMLSQLTVPGHLLGHISDDSRDSVTASV